MTTFALPTLLANSSVGFGTSGVRGLVSELTDRVCAAYSLAFLQALELDQSGQRVAIGMDLRPSSPAIVNSCIAGLRQRGVDVDFLGVLPTPALALYGLSHGIPSIMITGSHIPFDRNGIKFYRPDGEISKADEAAIQNATLTLAALQPALELPTVNTAGLDDYCRRYTQHLAADCLAGWRIGVYQHSSAARDCMVQILSSLGANVMPLGRSDQFVPIDTEAVSAEDRQRGRDWAAAHQLHAIISTDGDGDRPLIADENGDWLRGDIVGLLCAQGLQADCVVTPVSCNTAIEACGRFERVLRTRIGSPYVIAGMAQAQTNGCRAVAGFEANGGFLAGNGLRLAGQPLAALPTRDAVLPVLVLLTLAQQQQQPLSALLAPLPQRFTASNRLQAIATADSHALLQQLQNNAAACAALLGNDLGDVVQHDVTDGLRLRFALGDIIHLRPSGNAPELRCYAEAASMARAEMLVERVLAAVDRQVQSGA